ncbi:galactose-binding like protein [Pleurotus eryngii]|uniref:Galactose-binding like protein n=1 Tax=Pleurotus eryngii TaxID=5323 RepID=A0A9P6DDX6_PLEER|nr:galactose-binding like protein [Pleurotus eryngii]
MEPGATATPAAVPAHAQFHISSERYPPVLPWPDISSRGKWSVSSFKFGFGSECLRDGDPETFWHSDGPQPHFITIEFPQKVAIQKISIYLSFPQDDSYTPSTLAIRAGTGPSDLQDVRVVTLDKPDGWISFDVSSEPNEDGEGGSYVSPPINKASQSIILNQQQACPCVCYSSYHRCQPYERQGYSCKRPSCIGSSRRASGRRRSICVFISSIQNV